MFSSIWKLIVLAICLVGIGIYRGWFTFSNPTRDPAADSVNINVSVNSRKIDADAQKVEQRVSRQWQEFENAQPAK
jgi:hypothetical protein